jgi:hypothetical protein
MFVGIQGNLSKAVAARLSARAGFHITPACRTSLAPLIQGEAYPPCTHGLPDYVRLTNRVVPKKLPTAFTLSTVHGTARVPPEGRDPRSQTLSWCVHRTSRRSRRANGSWARNKTSPSAAALAACTPLVPHAPPWQGMSAPGGPLLRGTARVSPGEAHETQRQGAYAAQRARWYGPLPVHATHAVGTSQQPLLSFAT